MALWPPLPASLSWAGTLEQPGQQTCASESKAGRTEEQVTLRSLSNVDSYVLYHPMSSA